MRPALSAILALLVLTTACAAPSRDVLRSVGESQREACDEFARAAVESSEGITPGEYWLGGIAAIAAVPLNPAYILGPVIGPIAAGEAQRRRTGVYEQALKDCLKPIILERILGSSHSEVVESWRGLAQRLHGLASRYAADPARAAVAEALYRNALAVRERVLGPEDPDVASSLEGYAAFLNKTNRQAEAEQMEARAMAIRAKHERQNSTESRTSSDAPSFQAP